MTEVTDRTTASLDAYFGGLSALDLDRVGAAFADDAVTEDPVGSPENHGREAIKGFFGGLATLLSGLTIEPMQTYRAGGVDAVHWRVSWKGLNGRSGEFTGIDIIQFDGDGRIKDLRAYWDASPVMAAMTAT